jgi:hypothetical protein
VEAFSASVITARLLFTDNATLNLELSGGEAALMFYKVTKADLESYGICNAASIAFSAARALVSVEKLTVMDFIKKTSVAFGTALYNAGVLSCDNDVSLALSLFRFIQKALKDRDQTTFENQMYGVIKGVNNLYDSLKLLSKDLPQLSADAFVQEFLGDDECKPKKG